MPSPVRINGNRNAKTVDRSKGYLLTAAKLNHVLPLLDIEVTVNASHGQRIVETSCIEGRTGGNDPGADRQHSQRLSLWAAGLDCGFTSNQRYARITLL